MATSKASRKHPHQQRQRQHIVGIDPSLTCTGVAIIDGLENKIVAVKDLRMPSSKLKENWISRALYMSSITCMFLANYIFVKKYTIIMELPTVWSSHPKGYKAAEMQSTNKVSFLAGNLTEALRDTFLNCEIIHVTPNEWKGSVPKRITARRMTRRWNKVFKVSDLTDAVGIATWFLDKEE